MNEAADQLRAQNPFTSVHYEMAAVITESYRQLRLASDAIALGEYVLAASREELGPTHYVTARALADLSWSQMYAADYERGAATMQEALNIATDFADHQLDWQAWYARLAIAHINREAYNDAEEAVLASLQILQKNTPPPEADIAARTGLLATIKLRQGDNAAAEQYYRSALHAHIAVHGERHTAVAGVYHNLSALLASKPDLEQAIAYAEQAIDIKSEYYGADADTVARSQSSLGSYLKSAGQFQQAQQVLTAALPVLRKTRPETSTYVVLTRTRLADSYLAQGEWDAAQSAFDGIWTPQSETEWPSTKTGCYVMSVAAVLGLVTEISWALDGMQICLQNIATEPALTRARLLAFRAMLTRNPEHRDAAIALQNFDRSYAQIDYRSPFVTAPR